MVEMSPKDVHVCKTKTIVGGHNVITILSVSTLHLLVGVFHSLVALFFPRAQLHSMFELPVALICFPSFLVSDSDTTFIC